VQQGLLLVLRQQVLEQEPDLRRLSKEQLTDELGLDLVTRDVQLEELGVVRVDEERLADQVTQLIEVDLLVLQKVREGDDEVVGQFEELVLNLLENGDDFRV